MRAFIASDFSAVRFLNHKVLGSNFWGIEREIVRGNVFFFFFVSIEMPGKQCNSYFQNLSEKDSMK